jgi:CrcB protein
MKFERFSRSVAFSRHFMNFLLVTLGGALGSGLRYLLTWGIAVRLGESFPFGTLAVNVIGSVAIGFFATISGPEGRWLVPPAGRLFFMTGVCGGFTTFSAFSLQTLHLARNADWLYAGLNILGSVALCLIGVWLGHVLAAALNR